VCRHEGHEPEGGRKRTQGGRNSISLASATRPLKPGYFEGSGALADARAQETPLFHSFSCSLFLSSLFESFRERILAFLRPPIAKHPDFHLVFFKIVADASLFPLRPFASAASATLPTSMWRTAPGRGPARPSLTVATRRDAPLSVRPLAGRLVAEGGKESHHAHELSPARPSLLGLMHDQPEARIPNAPATAGAASN
jgi:hypothetical protein